MSRLLKCVVWRHLVGAYQVGLIVRRTGLCRILSAQVVSLGVLLFAYIPAQAESPLEQIAEQIFVDIDLSGLLSQCPADFAHPAIPLDDWTVLDCDTDAALCLARCLRGSATYCLALAYALQRAEQSEIIREATEMIFAKACAVGSAAGCTNRAAGLLNSQPIEDAPEALLQCTLRSFDYACHRGDAWGCTMIALLAAQGKGTKKDPDRARRAANRACVLWPDSEPCTGGKNFLRQFGISE